MLSTRTGHVLHVQRQRGANLRKLTRERRASNPATTQVSLLGSRIKRAQRRAMLSVTCDGEAPHKTTGTGCFEPIGLPGRHCDAPHANTARGPPERRTGRRATSLPLVPSTPGALTRQPCRKAAAVAWFACLRVRRPRDLARDVVFVPPSSHPLPSFRRCLPACPFVVPPASSSPLSFCAGLRSPLLLHLNPWASRVWVTVHVPQRGNLSPGDGIWRDKDITLFTEEQQEEESWITARCRRLRACSSLMLRFRLLGIACDAGGERR